MVDLPTSSEANASSQATNDALVNTANDAFIASATVLINNATNLGFYQVEPFVIPYLNIATIVSYFQELGYTVLYPICGNCNCSGNAGYPYEPCFVAGFPGVLPPGYVPWNCCPGYYGPGRISISWGPPGVEYFLLLENGGFFLLEDGISQIELE